MREMPWGGQICNRESSKLKWPTSRERPSGYKATHIVVKYILVPDQIHACERIKVYNEDA